MIMEAEKSRDILSESWRTSGTDGVNPSPRVEEYTCPCSISQVGSKRFEFLLSLSLCSIQAINGLDYALPH